MLSIVFCVWCRGVDLFFLLFYLECVGSGGCQSQSFCSRGQTEALWAAEGMLLDVYVQSRPIVEVESIYFETKEGRRITEEKVDSF